MILAARLDSLKLRSSFVPSQQRGASTGTYAGVSPWFARYVTFWWNDISRRQLEYPETACNAGAVLCPV